ncbi:stealth family protein (plasmid) [Streptomyces sp. BI20]|uniref:stealth family protein n=1 Tax=Streptomyces sp. BI20 TaxID=3403460 RepID=UPI003C7735D7
MTQGQHVPGIRERTGEAPGPRGGESTVPEAASYPRVPRQPAPAGSSGGVPGVGGTHNAEGSALVSVYRKVLPVRGRKAIARRFSPDRRRKVKQQLAAATATLQGGRLRSSGFAATNQRLIDGSGALVVTVGGRPRLAVPLADLSPRAARAHNLGAVTEALTAAGVEHFCVRGRGRGHTTVGVPLRDRAAALKALREHGHTRPGYLVAGDTAKGPGRIAAAHLASAWQRQSDGEALRLFSYLTDPGRRLVLGPEYGCDVEFWPEEDGRLLAPRRNAATESLPLVGEDVTVPVEIFTAPHGTPVTGRLDVRTRPEFTSLLPGDVTFPVDAVYTWVNGADPAWQARRARFSGAVYHAESANAARYADHDELRYSLRSIQMYAPWIRTVHLVTDDQVPEWLDTSAPGLRVVSHREIFDDPQALPTFNSHAIESRLHHIDGLSERFLYFNDDVFLGAERTPEDFFHANGLTTFFPSPALVPLGPRTDEDVPVSAAGKNNRALIEGRFGTTPVAKMRHTPHALSRAVLAEIEAEFPEQHAATGSHRFRSRDDLAIPSSLHHYYAFHTRRAVPGDLRYVYLDVAHPHTPNHLDRLLLNRDKDVFCVNDTTSDEGDFERTDRLVKAFLSAYFPIPSRFERNS